jgi:hypothetical protein
MNTDAPDRDPEQRQQLAREAKAIIALADSLNHIVLLRFVLLLAAETSPTDGDAATGPAWAARFVMLCDKVSR